MARARTRVLFAALASGVMTLALVTLGAFSSPPAHATTALSNISVTVTGNMCPRGGSVHRVNVAIMTPGTSGSTGGDTVGGLRAFYGADNVIGSNFCQTAWYGAGYYWYWNVTRYFWSNGTHMYI